MSSLIKTDMAKAQVTSVNEIVDIVSDDDAVLYQISKQEAHRNGLLHRTVISEVIDSKDRFLLVKQAPDRQDAGQFVSPVGGHVGAGELIEDALKREALEELGIADFPYQHIGKSIYERHVIGRHENHYFTVYEIRSDSEPVLNHESVDYSYFTEVELRRTLAKNPELFGNAFWHLVSIFYKDLLS